MKILVFSDSHGNNKLMFQIIEENLGDFDCIFHLGDHVHDAYEIHDKFPEIPIYFVRGNNDMENVPFEKKVSLEGVTFLLTHGHRQGVNFGVTKLAYFAMENNADVVVFGHIHEVFMEYDGQVAIFNPGSITYPRDTGNPSFGIIEVENGNIEFFAYRCTKNGIVPVK